MTNEEFIAKLRQAKKRALENYHSSFRIGFACQDVGLYWSGPSAQHNCTFGEGTVYDGNSFRFLEEQRKTRKNVARVFDESIRALGGKP